MTPITSEDPQLQDIPLEKVISYVQKSGWKQVAHPNRNLMVFQGTNDDLGQPIQLVLPLSHNLWDSPILLAKAINLLAEIEQKAPEEILAKLEKQILEKMYQQDCDATI